VDTALQVRGMIALLRSPASADFEIACIVIVSLRYPSSLSGSNTSVMEVEFAGHLQPFVALCHPLCSMLQKAIRMEC